ncbi:restriction endonuclease subunit S [Paenibacillus puldeungensis]|uniref:Restriction endonuclease subunit S n=1 Tax=Paenibacillus puldeungensis TaxID=696536 RepID=A0ABW3RSV0_9BACL
MNKKEKTILPQLRFHRFKDYPAWNIDNFGNIVVPVEERAGTKKYTLMSVTSGVGLIPQIEKFGREIAGSAYKNYYVIKKNDLAYNKSATKQFPEGYISMLKEYEEAALPNSIFTCFRVTDKECDPRFFDHLFHNNYHGSWLRKYIEVGARAHGSLSIDTQHLWDMPVALPRIEEQQKIADCLSSLDDLITAEDKKLEVYKAHKKGLMQKLFPADGKTVPEWRFPEFRGSGEWVKKSLGQLGELVSGLTYSPDDIRESGLLVLRSSNIKNNVITLDDNVYVRTDISGANHSVENDILICVRNGSKALIGKNAIIPKGMPLCTHGAFMTIFRTKFSKFVFQLLQSNSYEKQVKADLGATINSINGSQLRKYVFYIPKDIKEQEKIANCLSDLDTLITSQAEKIESLKVHKKGLMQGLFPSVEEVGE